MEPVDPLELLVVFMGVGDLWYWFSRYGSELFVFGSWCPIFSSFILSSLFFRTFSPPFSAHEKDAGELGVLSPSIH
ncbi:hypothetical protein B0H34DRAFT_686180 [Crassisporium funariophilum]|nr:hypothetical protein B0H34DRAFT_736099 [Crassisporium funariophilum]KAF8148606.1 hypothetical protein B0H34DRAFT_736191 [Crassisporium funariophilum]KAF8148620.1 hypothetical protein B0H34DRAFT_736269 [Crassisporium funariophilum]KAF8168569.1 hypothetical protein B0H34DRAFT_686180 [Crassisporium funariophilum]